MFKARFLALLILVPSGPVLAQRQTPYEAVTTTRVKVRCGAGEEYYTTAILKANIPVTVVREEPNEWLAIEPPDGSFSWIAGEFVRELSATEGEVTGNDVLVRIGTPADPRKRDIWQKKLKRGDRVKILEKSTSGEGPLTRISYKIVPPAGEVRYVHAKFVEPAGPRRASPNSRSAATPPARNAAEPRDLATGEHDGPADPHVSDNPELDDRADSVPVRANPGKLATIDEANASFRDMIRRPIPDRNIAAVRALYEQAAQTAKNRADHELIAQRLEFLHAQEERKAKFLEFERALERARQRHDTLLSVDRSESEEGEPGEEPAEEDRQSRRFDASGVLRRSTAILDGRPAYVLLSPQGGIRYYVTPSPGIDLNKYLDKIVAVRGPSSYRVEVRAQHIIVRDITVIELNPSGYRETKPERERGTRRS